MEPKIPDYHIKISMFARVRSVTTRKDVLFFLRAWGVYHTLQLPL